MGIDALCADPADPGPVAAWSGGNLARPDPAPPRPRVDPRSAAASFEEWIDCIAVTEIDSEDDAYLSPELIGEVAMTRDHILVKSHSQTLLIPTRAFASPAEAAQIVAHLRDLATGPYYFDPQD